MRSWELCGVFWRIGFNYLLKLRDGDVPTKHGRNSLCELFRWNLHGDDGFDELYELSWGGVPTKPNEHQLYELRRREVLVADRTALVINMCGLLDGDLPIGDRFICVYTLRSGLLLEHRGCFLIVGLHKLRGGYFRECDGVDKLC